MIDTQSILSRLGYSESEKLYFPDSNEVRCNHSLYKLFVEIQPKAIYMADNKPFIAFCESNDKKMSSTLVKKIWNAQIPLLIVNYKNRIEVYNGCSIDSKKNLILLESLCNETINEDSPFSFWKISNATFWPNYDAKLSRPKLDVILLDNIREATNRLKETPCSPFAVKVILRLIFIRYLIDRGVDLSYGGLTSDVSSSQANFLTILQDKSELYGLFFYLKDRFNGNLFELYEGDNGSEIDLLDNNTLNLLHELMSGDMVLSSGQTSLFPLYDFNIIPVELISNIYERFLGEEQQKKDKAFYTPPYLVDYLLTQTVTPFLRENTKCTILDPACGSGIFLVESARKLIEKAILDSRNTTLTNQELVDVVTNCLWGIDKNPESIDVAIFSIYLTILDYKDPKTLKNFKLPFLRDQNFFVGDFFSEQIEIYFRGKQFDFIIGNPPWGSISGLHEKYCRDKGLPIQGKEISRSFVLRTKDFSHANTCCCLIVTSKLFYNKKSSSVDFRKWLLVNSKIDKYIELAAVRELIFTKVRGPAGVIIYRFSADNKVNLANELCHLTLKPNVFFKLFNIIVIEKNDYKFVPQSLLLEYDWTWKTLVFGFANDFHLIKNLMEKYRSIQEVIKQSSLKYGTGIRVADGEKQDASHLVGQWLIDAEKGIHPFEVIKANGKTFTKEKIHRAKKDKMYLFQSPYVLVKKGFDTQSYKFRAAYTEESFLYTDAITGICGHDDDKNILLSLDGLINSSFYSYLNLMLGSSSGIEREQGFPTEIFQYPTVINAQISELANDIQSAIAQEREGFSNSNESSELMHTLDTIILEQFGLSDDSFVDYALNIQIPLVAKNKMIWESVTSKQLHEYAQVLIDYFSKIFTNREKYVSANIFNNIAHHYCAIEFVFQDTVPSTTIIEYEDGQKNHMEFMSKFALHKVNDLFYQMRDVISFSQTSFYILKTNEYRSWHPAMAKLDLSDVLNSIFVENEEGCQ